MLRLRTVRVCSHHGTVGGTTMSRSGGWTDAVAAFGARGVDAQRPHQAHGLPIALLSGPMIDEQHTWVRSPNEPPVDDRRLDDLARELANRMAFVKRHSQLALLHDLAKLAQARRKAEVD